ncbi:bifunctional 4-hydroxy-2-oxoglutarate aldolase/2-dehydro-3-deoxy-phosphogluconate aldolase [Rhodobacteraceae bacterium NNCM2]|nr:bifunctional 4-hydroxy-2-oxoglutarate aldolase/2-dehydro-3-deoxy-phosphogluconate aldolase [Coraliihabitans acroporae]
MPEIADRLIAARVIPVIRTSAEETARRSVELLRGSGFDVFEITMTTPGSVEIIRDLARDPSLCIGVGTVLDAAAARTAIEAGASFVVSPACIEELAPVCAEAGVPLSLGAATPTEAHRAQQAGAAFVKIFPAAQLGGPGYIKALRSVFPQMKIMPTGGINPENIAPYLAAGAVAVGMGGNLVNEAALKAGRDQTIRQAAVEVQQELDRIA